MKKILSLAFVSCLAVSCSHKSGPKYSAATTGTATEPTVVTNAEPPPPAPPVAIETNVPLVTTNVAVTNAVSPEAEKAIAAATNAAPGRLPGARSPFSRGSQPSVPAPTPPSGGPVTASTAPEQLLPAKSIDFRGAPLETVLQVYADYVNRTLLRASTLPQATITLTTQSPMTKKELIEALDAVLALNGIAMVPVGDKFIKVAPSAQANQLGAEFNEKSADELPNLGSYVTHIVQLKYAKPSELVQVLQPFASQIPNPITPIDSSGILVLRDYTENVKRMLEMIQRVDTIAQPDVISEVIPIKYALARDIADALNSLSGGGGGTTSFGSSGGGGTGSMGTTRATGATGIGRPGMTGTSGTTYNRQGFGGNTTTGGGGGGGIGTGSIGGGAAIGSSGGSFSDRVRNLINRAATSTGGAGEFQILGQTKIIADERTNSLLIFASRQDMEMIKDVVAKLDVVLAQVLIEAIIMEVSLDNAKDFGVSAAQNQKRFGSDASGVGGFNNGQPFFGTGTSNSFPGNFTSALPGGSGNSLSYWGQFGGDWNVAVQAMQSDSRINVLSRPRIQTSHGVEADLFVGQSVPYITGTTYGDFAGVGSRSQYDEKQIGITLKVKPLINPDGLVVMDIYQDIGQRGTDVIIDGNPVPQVNERQASATVAVKDRDTIILGGFISNTKSKSKTGVPYLQDIPLLGNLFRSTSDSQTRVELVVLLRPTVLPTPESAAMVAKSDRKNLPGVRRAEAEFKADEAARIKQADKDLGPNDEKVMKDQ